MSTTTFFVARIIVRYKNVNVNPLFIFYFNPANRAARGKELSARCRLSKALRGIETQLEGTNLMVALTS